MVCRDGFSSSMSYYIKSVQKCLIKCYRFSTFLDGSKISSGTLGVEADVDDGLDVNEDPTDTEPRRVSRAKPKIIQNFNTFLFGVNFYIFVNLSLILIFVVFDFVVVDLVRVYARHMAV